MSSKGNRTVEGVRGRDLCLRRLLVEGVGWRRDGGGGSVGHVSRAGESEYAAVRVRSCGLESCGRAVTQSSSSVD